MADLDYYRSLEDYERIKDYLDVDPEGFEIPVEIEEFQPDFSKAIIIDNIPVIPKDKMEKLTSVILKIYVQISDQLTADDLYMPFNDDAKTTYGFCFIKFASKEDAEKAVQRTNGFELSKTNKFKVSLYSDLQKYENYPEEYSEPNPPPFKPRPDIIPWLTDVHCRDQFVTRYLHETEICWGNLTGEEPTKVYGGEREKAGGKVWCESFVSWSPQGTYLATYHVAGIKLWGGEKFEAQCRFAHSDVEIVDFSPCESYMVTYRFNQSKRAITDEPIICWDIRKESKIRPFEIRNPFDLKYHAQALIYEKKGDKSVERLLRGKITGYNEHTNEFTITEGNAEFKEIPAEKVVALQEPNRLKWSSNGRYLGRVTCDAITIYAAPDFLLLDKKSIATKDVLDFVWSPSSSNCMLSYWAPASGNHPSLVSILQIPERTDLCSRKLFDVSDGKMVWQSEGDYLCVHMTKTSGKKKTFILMFFRVCEIGIPVEQIELNEPIVTANWEPSGDRICVVHGEPRNAIISFYSMSGLSQKATSKGKKELTFLFSIRDSSYQCNNILWSPAGDIIAISFMAPDSCTFHLYDVENNVLLAKRNHDRGNRLVWDPSGRLLVSCTINSLKQERVAIRGHPDDGFIMFTFQGNLLNQVRKEKLYQFEWRPRPKDLLTQEERQKVIKNLKKYERLFEKEDKQRKQEMNQELTLTRRKLAQDFYAILLRNRAYNQNLLPKRFIARDGYDENDERNYTIEYTTEEEIISTKEQVIQ